MKYLLDTNVWVDYLTGRHPTVTRRIRSASPDELALSSVVLAELRYGADRSLHRRRNHERIDILVAEVRTVPFDAEAAAAFGQVRAALEERGLPIGPYDMLIAAHALALGTVLVTDNVGEFRRVAGLRVENWRAG